MHNPALYDIPPHQDYSFSVNDAGKFARFTFFLTAILVFSPFFYWLEAGAIFADIKEFIFNIYITIPVLIIGIILHELLHASIYWLSSGVQKGAVKFGFHKRTLTPYTWFCAAVEVKLYRISVLFPLLILGIIPLIISYIILSPYLAVYAWIFIFTASADILSFWKIRKLKPTQMVMDHPARVGCYLLEPQDQ